MMRLSQIASLVGSLDGEGRSPIADALAARWGYVSARFRRSSASHVFALAEADGEVTAFLRFAPDTHRTADQLARIAAFVDALVEHGAPAARTLRSRAGHWVETIDTEIGVMHATVTTAATGEQIDTAALTVVRAHAWGQALARTHQAATPYGGSALPAAIDRLTDAMAGAGADRPLASALGVLLDRLSRLPTDSQRFGITHGDFELDNLAWIGDRPSAFDFDEAARSWYVADIGYAVRDLAPVPARTPTAGEAPLFGALLAGYRQVRPLPEADLYDLPLFATLHAATDLLRLRPAVDAGASPTDPAWLTSLRHRIDNHIQRLRLAVLRHADGS